MSVTLEDEDFETIREALKVADELCTNVISGHRGGQVKALEFARVLNELKRRKIVTNK
jgi:hypothetical protein